MIEPAAGWQQKTEFGFMGTDSVPPVRLVRLGDVFRWLNENPTPRPRDAALAALCDALPDDVMRWLYQVNSSGYATLVPQDHLFGGVLAVSSEAQGMFTAQQTQGNSSGRFGGALRVSNGKFTTSPPEPTEPGLPALVKAIKLGWKHEKFSRSATVAIQDDPRIRNLAYLAIPIEKAHALWGWGSVAAPSQLHIVPVAEAEPTNWVTLVKFRKNNPQAEWNPIRKGIAAQEAKRRKGALGSSGVAIAMAEELGITVSRLNQLIREEKLPGKRETVRFK